MVYLVEFPTGDDAGAAVGEGVAEHGGHRVAQRGGQEGTSCLGAQAERHGWRRFERSRAAAVARYGRRVGVIAGISATVEAAKEEGFVGHVPERGHRPGAR